LTDSTNAQVPGSWHPIGKYLAFQEQSPQTGRDLMILPVEGDGTSGWKPGKPSVFLASPAVLDYRIIEYFLRLLNPTSAA